MITVHAGQPLTIPPTPDRPAAHEHAASTARRETATRIEQDYPLWLVMWGAYSEEYWAYPRFDAPKGTILHSPSPDDLTSDMRAIQVSGRAAGPSVSNGPGPRSASAPPKSTGLTGSRMVSDMG
jgi:hypothetical protein